ncbi:MAG TPA: cytochrome C oxidase subunit IV family protein [Paucimonas sp.]|nr:cytochrome C oxidase subunit IV family protein [Paucimonas sp.]HJW57717.1 cytochrome C oxidase subunit IV family protein [Burkholderiaceae bacterium]
MRAEYKRCLLVWLGLMALLALTFGSAWLPLGIWNGIINLGIAALKAGLVAAFFMHLNTGSGLIRIVAAAALFTLALLFALSGGDYATRGVHPAPWQKPQQLPAAIAPR